MLGIAVPVQKEAGKHISEYRKIRAGIKTGTRTLSDFEEQEKEDISALLSVHIDAARLEKAKEIKDIEIIESGGDRIVPAFNGYSVYIVLEKKVILHDCPDWKRAEKERLFCKPIGAILVTMPADAAGKVLGD